MVPIATASSKKGFSLIEFLVSLFIVTLALVALTNAVVFFLHQKVKNTVASRTADAALELINSPSKLDFCNEKNPCDELTNNCDNSVYCGGNTDICNAPDSCIVCYTNPKSGRKIYYGLGSSKLSNGTYKVELCWIFGDSRGNYTTVITLP